MDRWDLAWVHPAQSKEIRNDSVGAGYFGASRKKRDGTRYPHKGVDYIVEKGWPVFSPINGIIQRKIVCYHDTMEYRGIIIQNPDITVKLLYVNGFQHFKKDAVAAGDRIGVAQDISKRYPGCQPHVHVEIVRINPDSLRHILMGGGTDET